MSETTSANSNLWSSFVGVIDGVLDTLRNRIELVAVEIQEERYNFITLVVCAVASVFLIGMALVFATLTLIYITWSHPEFRLIALAGVSIFYIVASIFAVWTLVRKLKTTHVPFESTIQELKKDQQWLNTLNSHN